MKAIKTIMAIIAMFMTSSIQAQESSFASANTNGWQNVYFQWNPSTAVTKGSGDDQAFTGLTIGYNKGFAITPGTPIYVEAGAALQYSFFSTDGNAFDESDSDDKLPFETKFSMVSAKIPVSLTYDWQVSPTISILPYAGLTGRFNIVGSLKHEITDEDRYSVSRYGDKKEFEKSRNIFDKKDMGDNKDAVFNRFQLGWQIGLNASFNKSLLLGISYGSDFSYMQKSTKSTVHTTSITLGYYF
jgi:hypothetical protein